MEWKSSRSNSLMAMGLALLLQTPAPTYPADTNALPVLRAALQANPGFRNTALGGVSSGAPTDPRAAAIAGKLRQLVQTYAPASTTANLAATMTSNQQQAVRLLQEKAADAVVHWRPENQTAMQIRGRLLESPAIGAALAAIGDRAEPTARNFLRRQRALLRLGDPDRELALAQRSRDELGHQHFRFTQVYQGLPVWPAGLSVHLDTEGNVYLLDGAYIPSPEAVDTQPGIDANTAIKYARAGVAGGGSGGASQPELIIYAPLKQSARLGWKLSVSADLQHVWQVVVDARDGNILDYYNQCVDANVVGSGKDLQGKIRTLNVWQQTGTNYLIDSSKSMFQPAFDPIKDPHGVIGIVDAKNVNLNQIQKTGVAQITSADPNNWLVPEGVSAAVNFSQNYDYFLERHNRNSIDGQGGAISAVVRVAELDNAFWNGELKMMFFGNVQPYPAALDIIGHELTHGVTQHTANLVYANQPGAMNEAFSDIFGEMVEARTVGQPDWLCGTGLAEPARNMRDPRAMTIGGLNRPYPAKMSQFINLPNTDNSDHGGVHINSSIINHAYYLLAAGLPNAVGLRDAERIFYACLTQHLQPQSQFIDARLGCIASAEVLFGAGSTQAQKVAEAFDTVEIFTAPSDPAPSPIPVVQGSDSTLFVYVYYDFFGFVYYGVGRQETAQGDSANGRTLAGPTQLERPAVSGDGSLAVFVDSSFDLAFVATANPNSAQRLGFPGLVHSVAVSPDRRYYAMVLRNALTGQPDNQINVFDLGSNVVRTFKLVAPVLDAAPVNNVLYADAMVFSSDSQMLIYDAVSQINFIGVGTVERSSIFGLTLATAKTTMIVPPVEHLDTGNPAIGRAGTRYLTFDLFDERTTNSTIVNMDLVTGKVAPIGTVKQWIGTPCFTGDESAVIYTKEDANATTSGYSLVKQALAADRLTPVGAPTLWIRDAAYGVIYRRGTFIQSNALPIVTVTSPTNGVVFTPPATITILANATDSDGQVAKVEFYQGSVKLGEAATAPYRFTWNNVAAGNYRLIARASDNVGGTTDSNPVTITVGAAGGLAPTITTQPLSQAVAAGGSVTFTVAANGTSPLAYQWQFKGTNLAGANAASLVLSQVQTNQAGPYRVVVSNAAGSVTSADAILTITPQTPPAANSLRITSTQAVQGPASKELVLAFNSETGKTYTLEASANLQSWTALSNITAIATSTTFHDLAVSIIPQRFYRVKSAAAAAGGPGITTQPVSQTVAAGVNVTFSVVAAGTGLQYQWKKDGQALPGQTSASLALANVTAAQAGVYTVEVSNPAGTVASNPATLTVTAANALAIMPVPNQIYTAGTKFGGALFGVEFTIPPGWLGGLKGGSPFFLFLSDAYPNIVMGNFLGFAGDQNLFLQDPSMQSGFSSTMNGEKIFMAVVKPLSASGTNRLTAEYQGAGSAVTYYMALEIVFHPSGGYVGFTGWCTPDKKDPMKAQLKAFADSVQNTTRPTNLAMMTQLNGRSYKWTSGGNDWYHYEPGYYTQSASLSDWSDNYTYFCAQGTFEVSKTTTTYASTTSASGVFMDLSGSSTTTEYGQWTIVQNPQYGNLIFMVTLSGYQIVPIKFDVDGSLLVGPNKLVPYGVFDCH